MRHFHHTDGELHAEQVPLSRIADDVGTPVYVYSRATLTRHYRVFAEAFADVDALIAFAVKANSNLAVLKTLGDLGAGADVVSGGELIRANRAGIPGERIVFSGVGKTRDEMQAALAANIRVFNVESREELRVLSEVATALGVDAPVAFRVNPDIAAGGHAKISTGQADNKFGIAWQTAMAAYAEAARLPGIRIVGVDVHIGSQIDKLAPYEATIARVDTLIRALRADGHTIDSFDLGGGLGIAYRDGDEMPSLTAYADMIKRLTRDLDVRLIFEPGRLIAGNAGVLLSRVLYTKDAPGKRFLVLDAAMNDLIRPALYDAYHAIEPVLESDGPAQTYDVVGPICESGDTFARDRDIAGADAGELVVIHSAGAYGAVQSSSYNSRPLVPEVMVDGDRYHVVRRRPSIEDLLSAESIPDWV